LRQIYPFSFFRSSENNVNNPQTVATQYHDVVDMGAGEEVGDEGPPRKPWMPPTGEGVLSHIWCRFYESPFRTNFYESPFRTKKLSDNFLL
jgi:hypothetical protein